MKITLNQLRQIIKEEVEQSMGAPSYKIGQRIMHATEPDMYGRIESAYDDDDDVRVKWDGGVAQYVSKSDITPMRAR